jgi:peroxiredoxin
VLGISVDSVHSHHAFAEQLGGISFPLLADFHPKGEMIKAYGLWREERGYSSRAVVIVDESGRVQYVEVIPTGMPDVEKILSAVNDLRQAKAQTAVE